MGVKEFFEKISPGTYIAKAINDTPQEAVAKAAGGDKKREEALDKEQGKFVGETEIEISHTGTAAKGFGQGLVNGFVGGEVVGGNANNTYKHIWNNGGNHEEFSRFKKAAGDPRDTVANGTPKQELNFTVKDYKEFCEATSKVQGQARKDISKATEIQLRGGEKLDDVTERLEKNGARAPEKDNKGNIIPTAIEVGANTTHDNDMQKALAQADSVDKSGLQMRSDNTALGCPEGDKNLVNGKGAPSQGASLA